MRIGLTFLLCITVFVSSTFAESYCDYPNLFVAKKSRQKRAGDPVYKTVKHYGKNQRLNILINKPRDKYKLAKRPVVIGVHGGGFMDICPFFKCYQYFSVMMNEQFTRRGFISASVEYRLHPRQRVPCNVTDAQLIEAHYMAVQDVRDAIQYLMKNADKYGIDRNNVFLMGNSAGATTVMHAAFLDNRDIGGPVVKKHGRLAPQPKVKGVLSYSGALYDLNYIDRNERIGLFLAHGTKDTTVPIGKKPYFGCKNRLPVYGSREIARKMRSFGFPTDKYFFNGGHSYPKPTQEVTARRSVAFMKRQIGCGGLRVE